MADNDTVAGIATGANITAATLEILIAAALSDPFYQQIVLDMRSQGRTFPDEAERDRMRERLDALFADAQAEIDAARAAGR